MDASGNSEGAWDLAYGELMLLLHDMFAVRSEEAQSIFLSRYKNLQKLGIPAGERPKQGKRAKYSLSQVCEWVFAFELLELGIDQRHIPWILRKRDGSTQEDQPRVPNDVVIMVSNMAKKSKPVESLGSNEVWVIDAAFLSRSWSKTPICSWVMFEREVFDDVAAAAPAQVRHRLCALNISALARDIALLCTSIKGPYRGDDPEA